MWSLLLLGVAALTVSVAVIPHSAGASPVCWLWVRPWWWCSSSSIAELGCGIAAQGF